VTTRTGDDGYTSLLGDIRVPKYHRRPEAFGTVDEATSALGLARAQLTDQDLNEKVRAVQRDLYVLMAELATPPENYAKVDFKIDAGQVEALERWADSLKEQVEIGKEFIIPGASVQGAALDVARTVVRRAERLVARLYHEGDVTNVYALQYLNRLSDLLFVLARYVERDVDQAGASSSPGSTSNARDRSGAK
jgi:cob(I)alamin adenosyltransferase